MQTEGKKRKTPILLLILAVILVILALLLTQCDKKSFRQQGSQLAGPPPTTDNPYAEPPSETKPVYTKPPHDFTQPETRPEGSQPSDSNGDGIPDNLPSEPQPAPSDPDTPTTPSTPGNQTQPSTPADPSQPSTPGSNTGGGNGTHSHQWDAVITYPTCSEGGYTTHYCSCGEHYFDAETEALGHNWLEANCTEPQTCSRCGLTEGEPAGHQYDSVVTPPAVGEGGYTTYTCRVCGNSYKADHTDPLDEIYAKGSLVFGTDGIARFYGDDDVVTKTFTGWLENTYSFQGAPWYSERNRILYVIIEEGITCSMNYWFYNCSELISVTMPSSISCIGEYAFHNCQSLEQINIPQSVQRIEQSALSQCTSLVTIHIPGSVSYIAPGAFSATWSIRSYSVAAENPVYHAQNNCLIETQTKTLLAGCQNSVIPSDGSVTSIADFAFYECRSLTEVTIPDCVTSIGNSAFAFCRALSSVNISANTQLNHLGYYAFSACYALTSIDLSGTSVTRLDGTFMNCNVLSEVLLPDTLTYITERAFCECGSLRSIVLPKAVKLLDYAVFFECYALEEIRYLGTMEQWAQIEKDSAWNGGVPAKEVICSDGAVSIAP